MSNIRRPRLIECAAYAGLFVAGLFLLAANEFGRHYGTTPKQELTVVTGKAANYMLTQVRGRFRRVRKRLHFTVEGQRMEYESQMPNFQKVLEAVQNGTTMTLGVSTKRETLIPGNGVRLYFLSIGPDQVVTYEETIARGYRGSTSVTVGACALLLLAGWGLYTCYQNRDAPLS